MNNQQLQERSEYFYSRADANRGLAHHAKTDLERGAYIECAELLEDRGYSFELQFLRSELTQKQKVL